MTLRPIWRPLNKSSLLMKLFPIVSSLLLAPGLILGQAGLDPAEILKPLADQWTTYSGDYSGKRHSSLKDVNQSTVRNLSLSWVTRFTTGCAPAGPGPAGGGR